MEKKSLVQRIGFVIGIMIFVLGFIRPVTAFADTSATIELNHATENNLRISFENSDIIFEDFPDAEEFNYVMLSLYGEDGVVYQREYYSTEEAITYSVAGMEDGVYYIQIYRSAEYYSTYWSYLWKTEGIKIEIKGGEVTPLYSPVYKNNIALYETNLESRNVLEYYLQPSYGVESDDDAIQTLAAAIVNETDSDYEKLKKVHDWVCNNVWYNRDGLYSGQYGANNAIEVLDSKLAVCQGYANLSAALLRALGIPTKVVSGYALGIGVTTSWTEELVNGNMTNHAWNEAYVDGRWIIMDTTWNSSNKLENGEFSTGTGLDGYKYFDPTLYAFSIDHKTVDNEPYHAYEEEMFWFIDRAVEQTGKKLTLYYNGETGKTKTLPIKIKNIFKAKSGGYYFVDFEMEELEKVDLKVKYYSKNNKVATAYQNGKVKAKGVGTTTVKVKVSLNGVEKIYDFDITVKDPVIKLKKYTRTMKVGETFDFDPGLYGVKNVTWTSSKASVATVDSNGVVTAKKAGTTYIKVSGNGCVKKIKVTITK